MLTPSSRIAVIVTLALAVVAAFLVKGQNQTPTSPTARFQIVQGDYVAVSGSTGVAEKGVFRIDTTTGKTWKFVTPRWTPENRPYVDTSKPANGAEPGQEYL